MCVNFGLVFERQKIFIRISYRPQASYNNGKLLRPSRPIDQ